MADAQKPLTPSAIKYLLTLLELCQKDAGARCMDIAEQLRVTKPSVHSMIENLCAAGLAEKRHGVLDAGGPDAGGALCGLLFAPARKDAADAGTERRGRAQRGLRGACAAAGRCAADDGAAEPRLLKRRRPNGTSHIRTGRRRGLRLHRRSQGRLPEADKKMTGAVRLHKKKSAVRRIFSTYLQFSQPVRRPQPCR